MILLEQRHPICTKSFIPDKFVVLKSKGSFVSLVINQAHEHDFTVI